MKYKNLGNTGVKVSSLCFGTMSFGGDADEATSAAMFHRCREAGINFFDCANVYSRGRAEEILGKLMAGSRDELVITAPIIGARSLAQLEGLLQSLQIDMTPELRTEISALSPEPPLATDRAEEKSG